MPGGTNAPQLRGLHYTKLTRKALRICFDAHRDQQDKSGLPYVFHPFHLAEQMDTEAEFCTALLHDVVEDSGWTIDALRQEGFPEDVLRALTLLTHREGVPYMEYVAALRSDPLARRIKQADLAHNSDPDRLGLLTAQDRRRLRRYRIAQAVLAEDQYDPLEECWRKRIPLEERGSRTLSVLYTQEGGVRRYVLENRWKQQDGRPLRACYLFGAAEGERLRRVLDPACSLPEGLAEFTHTSGMQALAELLEQENIPFEAAYQD